MAYLTVESTIGNTPLVQFQCIPGKGNAHRGSVILGKLEGNNPAGSVKDRPALPMAKRAEARGRVKPDDTLIEATPGNTGIALTMAAAVRGYKMVLAVLEDLLVEHRQSMAAYGVEIILTPVKGGMEYVRDLASAMKKEDKGVILDQLVNPDNPLAHYEITGLELWCGTESRVAHFVLMVGTTGTITGISRFLKEKNVDIQIIGAQPEEGLRIPGVRKWPEVHTLKIYDPKYIDHIESVSQSDAGHMARCMTCEEGISCGISAAGALYVVLRAAEEVEDTTIVFVVCDRDGRYLPTGIFPT